MDDDGEPHTVGPWDLEPRPGWQGQQRRARVFWGENGGWSVVGTAGYGREGGGKWEDGGEGEEGRRAAMKAKGHVLIIQRVESESERHSSLGHIQDFGFPVTVINSDDPTVAMDAQPGKAPAPAKRRLVQTGENKGGARLDWDGRRCSNVRMMCVGGGEGTGTSWEDPIKHLHLHVEIRPLGGENLSRILYFNVLPAGSVLQQWRRL